MPFKGWRSRDLFYVSNLVTETVSVLYYKAWKIARAKLWVEEKHNNVILLFHLNIHLQFSHIKIWSICQYFYIISSINGCLENMHLSHRISYTWSYMSPNFTSSSKPTFYRISTYLTYTYSLRYTWKASLHIYVAYSQIRLWWIFDTW